MRSRARARLRAASRTVSVRAAPGAAHRAAASFGARSSTSSAPVADQGPASALQRDHRIVGDDHDGDAVLPVEPDEQAHHLVGGVGVECPRRLVGQHHTAGSPTSAPRDRHALLLAAGELVGLVVQPVAHAHLAQDRPCAAAHLAPAEPPVDQRQRHVLLGAEVRQQVEGLEHEADVGIAEGGQLAVRSSTRRRDRSAGTCRRSDARADPGMFISVDLPLPEGPHDREQVAGPPPPSGRPSAPRPRPVPDGRSCGCPPAPAPRPPHPCGSRIVSPASRPARISTELRVVGPIRTSRSRASPVAGVEDPKAVPPPAARHRVDRDQQRLRVAVGDDAEPRGHAGP